MKNFPASLSPSAWCGAAIQVLAFCRLQLGVVLWLLAAPLLACSPTGINGLRSQVKIEVGKQFELGGRQLLGFRVAAHNVGPVAIEIKERTSNGRVMSVGLLQPGQETKAVFGMGSQAILVNLGQREAKIDVDISNGSGLSMGYAGAQPSAAAPSGLRVSGPDLFQARANDWRGTLTYLDYGTQKAVVLNTGVRGEMSSVNRLILRFDYEEPNKTHVFGADTLAVAPDGTHVRWDGTDFAVKAKQWLPDQTLRLVLEGPGRDDNRPVTIRKTLVLNPHLLTIRKQVQFAADTAFIQRNSYQFTR